MGDGAAMEGAVEVTVGGTRAPGLISLQRMWRLAVLVAKAGKAHP